MAEADSVPTPDYARNPNAHAKQFATKPRQVRIDLTNRRYFIGGSDARIIMGDDEAALIRLWREKRGEIEPEDLSGNLIVQLGLATEDLSPRLAREDSQRV
jgi:predicted phage-related endonuclease